MSSWPWRIFIFPRINISQVNFLHDKAADTFRDLTKKKADRYCNGNLPVMDAKTVPNLGELLVEVKVES